MRTDGVSQSLAGLQPEKVFKYFAEISAIPRDSHNEEAIASYLCGFATKRGFDWRKDGMNNVLIHKKASAGYEDMPEIMLQGHTDMVCAKNENSTHDFKKDPLQLYIKDGWIRAKETTLGADDGIAVAVMLALLDDDTIDHPSLSCLFTSAEEVGLLGAAAFDYIGIHAQILINLDSEDEGVACVSCAGGIRGDLERNIRRRKPDSGENFYRLRWEGFLGGHSGIEINEGRTNAIRAMAFMLREPLCGGRISLVSLDGGTLDNAIPRSCEAVISCRKTESDSVTAEMYRAANNMKAGFSESDGYSAFTLSEATPSDVMWEEDALAFATLLCDIPDGVLKMSPSIEGLVHTSSNMGIVRTTLDSVKLSVLARSADDREQEQLMSEIKKWAEQFEAVMTLSGEYPGWLYREDSKIRKQYCNVYRRLFGCDPKIEAIHAGLECGRIVHAMPWIDAISIGPTMRYVHTTEEALEIASVQRLWITLCEILSMKE